MKHRTACSVLCFLLLAACRQQPATEEEAGRDLSPQEVANELAAVQIEPGLWESSHRIVGIDAPGMPGDLAQQMAGRTTTATSCITPEQARRPDANFLAARRDSDCSYHDFAMRDGRIAGSMTCRAAEGGEEVSMRMEGQYGPQSYDITMSMETPGPPGAGDMTIEARATGRRIGDCPS